MSVVMSERERNCGGVPPVALNWGGLDQERRRLRGEGRLREEEA